jgi:hypothetical protein
VPYEQLLRRGASRTGAGCSSPPHLGFCPSETKADPALSASRRASSLAMPVAPICQRRPLASLRPVARR